MLFYTFWCPMCSDVTDIHEWLGICFLNIILFVLMGIIWHNKYIFFISHRIRSYQYLYQSKLNSGETRNGLSWNLFIISNLSCYSTLSWFLFSGDTILRSTSLWSYRPMTVRYQSSVGINHHILVKLVHLGYTDIRILLHNLRLTFEVQIHHNGIWYRTERGTRICVSYTEPL